MKIGRWQRRRGDASERNERLTFADGRTAVSKNFNHMWRQDLNAFFANSVNSSSPSMVNFPCCVCALSNVTREVTAQPTNSAVRMEAGAHAGV